MVETYNALFNKVHQLKLSQNAFDKPRIDVSARPLDVFAQLMFGAGQ